jgi:hypothetical protein
MPVAVAIKVSAELAESARKEASGADRSLTGQIEHWAKLGRAAEAIMPSQVANALKRCGGDLGAIEDPSLRSRALHALAAFQAVAPDALRRDIGLDQQTRFEPDPENPGGLIRIASDGTRTRGVMDGRTFVPGSP